MNYQTLPCHKCPQHKRYTDTTGDSAQVLHVCNENWYARVKEHNAIKEDDALVPLNAEELKRFWEMWQHHFFNCPYRREKILYKIAPLVLSMLAFVLSLINNDTAKSLVGIKAKDPKPTKIADPISVQMQSGAPIPVKLEQPIPIIVQLNSTNSPSNISNNNQPNQTSSQKRSP